MACRKAEYRAMTAVAEWKARQDERTSAAIREMEEALKAKWDYVKRSDELEDTTQPRICYLWLHDGLERGPACGCNGGCGKDHPRIILEFSGEAMAVLSHPLKPFQHYFDELCGQGLASKINATKYRLKGFLQEHVDRLKAQKDFGFHLVKVTTRALTDSRKAHVAHQKAEDEKKFQVEIANGTNKKRKHSELSSSKPALSRLLVEKVFQVVWDNSWFQDNLDLLDIHYWRMSGLPLLHAEKLAQQRLERLKLDIVVLVDGVAMPYKWTKVPDTSRELMDTLYVPMSGGGFQQYIYNSMFRVSACPLDSEISRKEEGDNKLDPSSKNRLSGYVWKPQQVAHDNNDATKFRITQTGNVNQNPKDVNWRSILRKDDIRERGSPIGHMVRVFIQEIAQDGTLFYSQELLGLEEKALLEKVEVARCRIKSPKFPDDKRVDYMIHHEGAPPMLEVKSVTFSFEDLVGVYVRRKLHASRRELKEIQSARPASYAEKEKVRRWARAAREHVPGHARDFEGLLGWDRFTQSFWICRW